MTNQQVLLAARPQGLPKETDFRIVSSPIPTPGDGEVLVETLFLSVDPYMRGRMNDVKSYAPAVKLDEVMVGGTVGRVVTSNDAGLSVGDIVEGRLGWQSYAVAEPRHLRKIDPTLAPISTALGVLGMPGMTAYFGLLDICKPQAGETVVVSGAAGAVGSLVGQVARIQGCRTVGIAGTDQKVAWLTEELGFDAAFNYKTSENYTKTLAELCPKGIDVYFDNVGGEITDAVFRVMNPHARISVCGQISQYNLEKPEMGPRMLSLFVAKQARLEGFLVFQFADRFAEGLGQMAEWLKDGRLKYREDIVDGLENAPRAFIDMLNGANTGKQLVRVAS